MHPELPFQVVIADLIGLINPKSSEERQYVLTLIDEHTKWTEAIPLKSVMIPLQRVMHYPKYARGQEFQI